MNPDDPRLRIAINAQIVPGRGHGGIESVLTGLVSALGKLEGPEEYVLICPPAAPAWLQPYIGSNQIVTQAPGPAATQQDVGEGFKKALGPLRPIIRRARHLIAPPSPPRKWPDVPVSNGFYESLGCEVIHFPYQEFVVCALASIYNPHDLQHRHFPQFFTAEHIAERETIYTAGCHYSHTVAVGSQWIKDDVIRTYGTHPSRLQVIPWAPPTQAYEEPTTEDFVRLKAKLRQLSPFAFYPAMTWEHKNHIRLLEALAVLRDRDNQRVNLVCTGHQNQFWSCIEQRIRELKLQDQVTFLGVVPTKDLRVLYRLSQFVVIPSLFEAASGPLYEAWLEGVAAACSTVTSLPEQAGDAALLFDPYSVEAIAGAIAQLAAKPGLREELQTRGARRLQDFSWERTAKAYRAVYRRAAHRALNEEDRWLLSWDWMREPHKKTEHGA